MTAPRKIPPKPNTGFVANDLCQDEACFQKQIAEGIHFLENGYGSQAQDLFHNMAECAAANKNIRYELLARGLINLSEGRILAAQSNLEAIYDHPYAHRLLKIISHYDGNEVELQTLHLIHNLAEEESKQQPENNSLLELKNLLEKTLQKNPPLSLNSLPGLREKISALPGGLGLRILESASLDNRARANALFALIQEELIPRKRIGCAYLIAKMFEKDPLHGEQARQYLANFEGIPKDPRWISTDFLDQGASYFFISLLALGAGRWASRGVWHFLTRGVEEISWLRRISGIGLSLAASTATYFISEKTILAATNFDGKIWPESGSELARELGADMIVMGLSNLMGGVFTWTSDRLFAPISSRFPPALRYLGYTLRSPLRVATWGLTGTLHATVLYGAHRWQDNIGMAERFRKGKALRLLPQEWLEIEYKGFEMNRAQQILHHYRSDSAQQLQNMKGDEVYHQIHAMKRWIRSLNEKNPQATQEEQLLGIFWIARACGKLNESAQDYLLKWMKESRYEKVKDYFGSHEIPLSLSPKGEILILFPSEAPSFFTP